MPDPQAGVGGEGGGTQTLEPGTKVASDFFALNPLYTLAGLKTFNAADAKYGVWPGDTTTDVWPNVKLAVADAIVAGGVVQIPAGPSYWNIDTATPAVVSGKSITVRGAGRDVSVITTPTSALATPGTFNVFTVAAGVSLSIEDMTIVGPTTLNGRGVRFAYKSSSNAVGEFIRVRRVYFQGWDLVLQGPLDGTPATFDLNDIEFSSITAPNSSGLCQLDLGVFLASNCYWHDFGLAASNQKHAVYLGQACSFAFSNHCRWDNNQGLGWCVQVNGGTAGTALFASYEDCWAGPNSGRAFMTSITVRTRFVNIDTHGAGRAIHHLNDAYLLQVTIDNSAGTEACLINGNSGAHKIRVRSSFLTPPAATAAMLANSADDYYTVDTEFGTTTALAQSAGAATSFMERCKTTDSTGWGAGPSSARPIAATAGANARWRDTTFGLDLISDGVNWNYASAPPAIYGAGLDGGYTLDGAGTPGWATKSGSVYTLTRDAALTTLNINGGVTLKTANFRLFVSGVLTNAGIIDNSGPAAVGAAGGTNVALQVYGAGNSGSTGGAGVGASPAAFTRVNLGGAGGAGGSGTPNAGGAGGALTGGFMGESNFALQFYHALVMGISVNSSSGSVFALSGGNGGGAGGGDGTNPGGGGGAGGGVIAIFALVYNGTGGVISANGGAGGNVGVGNVGGGGGGGGGAAYLIARSVIAQGTIQALAGALGTGFGTGVSGVAGTAGRTGVITA